MPVACSRGQRGTSIRNYALLTRATGMKIGEALYAPQAVYGQYEILTPAYDIELDGLYTLGGSARLGGAGPGDSGGGSARDRECGRHGRSARGARLLEADAVGPRRGCGCYPAMSRPAA